MRVLKRLLHVVCYALIFLALCLVVINHICLSYVENSATTITVEDVFYLADGGSFFLKIKDSKNNNFGINVTKSIGTSPINESITLFLYVGGIPIPCLTGPSYFQRQILMSKLKKQYGTGQSINFGDFGARSLIDWLETHSN